MSDPDIYAVGWICEIEKEYIAARQFLDEEHAPLDLLRKDTNCYTLGKLGRHNVVIAVPLNHENELSSATNVAMNMLHNFPSIRICLMVGIGGGAPSPDHDIRLGDIVVGTPRAGESPLIQYDFDMTVQGQSFRHIGFLEECPELLRNAVTMTKINHSRNGHTFEETINNILENNPRLRDDYQRPHPDSDKLFKAEVVHDPRGCAKVCAKEPSNLVLRHERDEDEDNPRIHYGKVGSVGWSMKDALLRDRLLAERDVLCFDAGVSGLMNRLPCLVIRGICDYSDSHRNKEWQGYSAMAAAAYAKDLLLRTPPERVKTEKSMVEFLSNSELP